MIWKYIIRDLNGAIQYLPYGVMALSLIHISEPTRP